MKFIIQKIQLKLIKWNYFWFTLGISLENPFKNPTDHKR